MSSSDDDDEDLKDMIDFGANVRRQSDVSNRMAGRISVNPKLLAAGDIFTRNYKKSDFKPLFNSTMLNHCKFEKTIARAQQGDHVAPGTIITKMVFPFNRPGTHGAMQYSYMFLFEPDFAEKVKSSFNASMPMEDREADLKILSFIDELPSYDAFLLKDKFEVEGVEIDPNYAEVSNDQYEAIKKPIMVEFQTIVESTLGQDEEIDTAAAAERLLKALWNLDDMDTLKPLIQALKMEEEEAPKHFYAWKGLLYYIHTYGNQFSDFNELLVVLRGLAAGEDHIDMSAVNYQLNKIGELHQKFVKFNANYKKFFRQAFETQENLGNFMKVLINARQLYWMLGHSIGILASTEDFVDMLTKSPASDAHKATEARGYLQALTI